MEEILALILQSFFEILVQGLFELPGYVLRWMFGVSPHDDPGEVVAGFLSLGFWGAALVIAVLVWRLLP